MALRRQHSILVLNGPNLNLLGTREPEVYGRETLDDIKSRVISYGAELGLDIDFQQWNGEGEMVTAIQQTLGRKSAIIINPAAYTHTSIAIMDALQAVNLPVVEVHLSNIHKREEFRHKSYVSRIASGVICGFGSAGYLLALDAVQHILDVRPA